MSYFYRCKKPVEARKKLTLQKSPNVITIHLKRFSYSGEKINDLIRYNESISLTSSMAIDYGYNYSLYGVLCHLGHTPESGHYYAYVKDRNGWHKMDDKVVSGAPKPPVNLRAAYVLFYIRTELPEEAGCSKMQRRMRKRKVVESDDDDTGVGELDKVSKSPHFSLKTLLTEFLERVAI
jgi:ubiquitin carboxyl-terminal hydrolase 36/42